MHRYLTSGEQERIIVQMGNALILRRVPLLSVAVRQLPGFSETAALLLFESFIIGYKAALKLKRKV
jgi:hypothetical protein